MIIQCDSGHLFGDLIACARYRLYDLRAKTDDEQITHVVFIIHLPHQVASSSFVGFQGDPWISSHIDDLRPTSNSAVSASEAIGLTISELFLGECKGGITLPLHFASFGQHDEPMLEEMSSEYKSTSDEEEQRVELERSTDSISLQEVKNDSSYSEDKEEREINMESWGERVNDNSDIGMNTEDEILPSQAQAHDSSMMTVDDIEDQNIEFEDVSVDDIPVLNLADTEENLPSLDNPSLDHMPALENSEHFQIRLSHSNVEANKTVGVCPVEPLPIRSPLHRRLHGCIQAAASRLKDSIAKRSTKRVEILIRLIPKDPPEVLGMYNSYLIIDGPIDFLFQQ